MKSERGLILIVSGPSGTGKSTVIGGLTARRRDVCFSVSATTRAPRPGETDGIDYYFRSPSAFEEMIRQGELLEWAEYVGNRYGTPAAPVDRQAAAGQVVLLDIEVQGAAQVMDKRPEAVSVFLAPPSLEELERRLRGRGTDPEEKILRRLETAREECAQAGRYDYIVVNDDVDTAVRKLDAIITAEKCRGKYMIEGDALL